MQSRLPYNATLSRRTQDLNTILSRNSMVSSALLRQAVGLGACSGTRREMQFERLHHLGTRLRSRVGFGSMAAEALLTTVSVAQADAGILQLYDFESASLQLVAQYGVEYPAVQALEFLSRNAVIEHLMQSRRRPVAIEQFAAYPGFAPHLEAVVASGIRSLQVLRFSDRKRQLTGILTTCFRNAGCAALSGQRFLTLYLEHAADLLSDRKQVQIALEKQRDERERLLRRIVFAEEEARRSIARDLHDDIGQRAALIAMNLQSLCRSLCNESGPSHPTSAQLASVTRDVDALSERLRELSHQLHPTIVEHLGLAHAVRSLVQDFNRGYQMKATIQSDKPCEGISVPTATTLYRIAQEALSNAAKYARTADITIALSEEASEVHLVIRDNGPGFEPAVKHGRGLGLMSMQERALALNCECEIRSNIGQGTEIKVRVPKYSEHEWSESPSCSEPWLKSVG